MTGKFWRLSLVKNLLQTFQKVMCHYDTKIINFLSIHTWILFLCGVDFSETETEYLVSHTSAYSFLRSDQSVRSQFFIQESQLITNIIISETNPPSRTDANLR